MKKKFRYQDDWEIIYIEGGFGRGAKVKRVEQSDLEFLDEKQFGFLMQNGFVMVYHYITGSF